MAEALLQQARKYDAVFVDFFDTIAFRRVHPREVIRLWAAQIRPYPGIACDAATLYKIRMQALDRFSFSELSYTFEAWMQELFLRLNNSSLIDKTISFERFLQLSLEVEETLEIQSQFPNEEVLAVLRELKKTGKKIYVVSDFYLPKCSLERFLESLGAREFFDDVFVSCDFGKTKSEGNLYPAVLEKLGLDGKQVFMIGDNRVSDCVNSGKHGIASFQLQHRYNNLWRKIADRILGLGTTAHGFHAAWWKYERECRNSEFYFSEYVLIYYFFTVKLFEELKKREIKNTIFLSREGCLLKKFFEIYQESVVPVPERIKTHYFQMSRQAAAIVRLKPLEIETFSHFNNISIHDFLIGCGFSDAQIEELAREIPRNFTQVEENFTKTEPFTELTSNKRFQEQYNKINAENKEAFSRYFRSLKIAADEEIGVVDVGWTGRMQDAIHELTGQNTAGFYVGLKTPASLGAGVVKNGLIFSTMPDYSRYYSLLSVNTQIYEQLLMAPHGSAVSYSLDVDGNCIVNENYREEEKALHEKTIRPVQEFMENVFRRLCMDVRLRVDRWEGAEWGNGRGGDWLFPRIVRLTMRSGLFVGRKRRQFISAISRGFVDNFGNMGVGKHYDAKKVLGARRILGFILHPETAMKYAVKICTLKNGFLRTLLFWFAVLPYYIFIRIKLFTK